MESTHTSDSNIMSKHYIIGVGVACVDQIISVTRYPAPDSKGRANSYTICGGGNIANALVTASRLGCKTRIVSRVGQEHWGKWVKEDLDAEEVDTRFLIRAGEKTAMSFVTLDETEGTRTIVHSLGLDLEANQLSEDALDGASLVCFDGRHTIASVQVAIMSHKKGVKVLVEGERSRPHLDELMKYAHYSMWSSHYHRQVAIPEDVKITSLHPVCRAAGFYLLSHPVMELVVATLGSQGSLLFCRRDLCRGLPEDEFENNLSDSLPTNVKMRATFDTSIGPVDVVSSRGLFSVGSCGSTVAVAVFYCPAIKIEKVVDSSGAGDTFHGALAVVLHKALSNPNTVPSFDSVPEFLLAFANRAAGLKCTHIGPRLSSTLINHQDPS